PAGDETVVVGAAALGAGAVAGREGRRLVEEEELRVAPGLEQRAAVPAAELEPAGDPALAGVAAANPTGGVVQTAAVAEDEAAARIGDELAERRDAVLPRHGISRTRRGRRAPRRRSRTRADRRRSRRAPRAAPPWAGSRTRPTARHRV